MTGPDPWAASLVATWPPLTPAQRAVIAAAFGGTAEHDNIEAVA